MGFGPLLARIMSPLQQTEFGIALVSKEGEVNVAILVLFCIRGIEFGREETN